MHKLAGQPFVWTEALALRALYTALNVHQYLVCPNLYMGSGEMDCAAISRAGYLTEFEIKLSIQDWRADRLKDKWLAVNAKQREMVKYFVYVVPDELADNPPPDLDPRFGLIALEKPFKTWPYGPGKYAPVARWRRQPKKLTRGRPMTQDEIKRLLLGVYYRFWNQLHGLPLQDVSELPPFELPEIEQPAAPLQALPADPVVVRGQGLPVLRLP